MHTHHPDAYHRVVQPIMEGLQSAAINKHEVKRALFSISGVIDVQDPEIRTITPGRNLLSCHILIEEDADSQELLQQVNLIAKEKFSFKETTIQVEVLKNQS